MKPNKLFKKPLKVSLELIMVIILVCVSFIALFVSSHTDITPFSESAGFFYISQGTAIGFLFCALGLYFFRRSRKISVLVGLLLIILGAVQIEVSFFDLLSAFEIPPSMVDLLWVEVFTAIMFILFGSLFTFKQAHFLRHVHFSEVLVIFTLLLTLISLLESLSFGYLEETLHHPLFHLHSSLTAWIFLGMSVTLLRSLYTTDFLKLKNWVIMTLFSVLFLSIAYVLILFVENVFYNQANANFEDLTARATARIDNRFQIYENTLEGGVGLFSASESVSRQEWKNYVETLDVQNNYPGIQGIGYSIFIRPQDRQSHVAEIRSQGFPEYDIRPAGQRDLYTSIIYLEPFDERNRQAFGFDMYQEANRRDAMNRARDTGRPALSGPITLVQEIDDDVQAGFLLYLPRYETLAPKSLEQRRESIIGYVYSPFRARDFVEGAIGVGGLDDIALHVYDADTSLDTNDLYNDFDQKGFSSEQPRFITLDTIERGGRVWQLVYSSSPTYGISLFSEILPLVVLIASILFSLLLSVTIYALLHSRQRAEDIATKMTMNFRMQQNRLEDFHAIATKPQVEFNKRIKQTLETVRLNLNFDTALVSHVTDNRYTVTHISSTDPNLKKGSQYDLDQTLCSLTYTTNKPVFFHNTELAAQTKEKIAPELQAATYVGIPISTNGRRYGTIALFGPQERKKFTQNDRTFIMLTANWIARLIESHQIDSAKNDFLTLASHQLRTPLSIINWYSELLTNKKLGELNEKQAKYVGEISTGNHRMIKIVNELLNASKLDMGSFTVEPKEISFETTLQAYMRQYEKVTADKKITYTQEIDPAVETIICDQTIVDLVLDNLLSNAFKYTPKNGNVLCTISEHDKKSVAIAIKDSGIGIPKSEEKKIFSKMFRATNVKEKDTDGTGLGLYMVRKAVNAVNGKISFESVENKGTTFTAILPKVAKKRDGTSRLVSRERR